MTGQLRDISEIPGAKYAYDSIAQFRASTIRDGLHTINFGGHPMDILYRHRGSDTTIVSFHAATSTATKLPVFSGTSLTADLPANVIFVCDPSLYIDPAVKLAWFAGNRFQDLQTQLPEIIGHIQSDSGAKNLIFFGASGGGFAALYYSSLFPKSLAVGVNPRTIVSESVPAAIERYAEKCWGMVGDSNVKKLLTSTIDSDLRADCRPPSGSTVAYVQNAQDRRYIRQSLIPYVSSFKDSSHIHLLMQNWGEGHVPADRKFLKELLTLATARAPYWDSALEELGFLPSPDTTDIASIQKELKTRSTQREVLVRRRWSQLMQDPTTAAPRKWPLDSLRPLSARHPITSSISNKGLEIRWTLPGARRLYMTTFDGDFSTPPTGPASDITSCLGQSLIEIQFATEGAPEPVALTLFALQYAGSERRRTDTWKFRVGAERRVHTALVPVLASTDSYRMAFLVHSKVAGGFVLDDLQTKDHR